MSVALDDNRSSDTVFCHGESDLMGPLQLPKRTPLFILLDMNYSTGFLHFFPGHRIKGRVVLETLR